MTLDDLIETLHAFRLRYPGAATAFVHCAVDLEEPWYYHGEVQLGFSLDNVDDDDEDEDEDEPAPVH